MLNKITIEEVKENISDIGVTIDDVVKFIKMNGTAYRDEILEAVSSIQTDEMIEIDNKILEEDKELWIEIADM